MTSPRYTATYSFHQLQYKYEDEILISSAGDNGSCWSVYAVMDGHNGNIAARFVKRRFLAELLQRLPTWEVPAPYTEHFSAYAEVVRQALTASFLVMEELLLSNDVVGGTTLTVAVQRANLLSVANVGDSLCVLDSGMDFEVLALDHRIGSEPLEETRLEEAGVRVARLKFDLSGPADTEEGGCGPLRAWPGGLVMSRSIGDSDVGSCILPYPNVKQVLLPSRGCRLVIASDGVWDGLNPRKTVGFLRTMGVSNAAMVLCRAAAKYRKSQPDDTSAIVVDLMPSEHQSFKTLVQELRDDSAAPTAPVRSVRRTLSSSGSLSAMSRSLNAVSRQLMKVNSLTKSEHGPPRYSTASSLMLSNHSKVAESEIESPTSLDNPKHQHFWVRFFSCVRPTVGCPHAATNLSPPCDEIEVVGDIDSWQVFGYGRYDKLSTARLELDGKLGTSLFGSRSNSGNGMPEPGCLALGSQVGVGGTNHSGSDAGVLLGVVPVSPGALHPEGTFHRPTLTTETASREGSMRARTLSPRLSSHSIPRNSLTDKFFGALYLPYDDPNYEGDAQASDSLYSQPGASSIYAYPLAPSPGISAGGVIEEDMPTNDGGELGNSGQAPSPLMRTGGVTPRGPVADVLVAPSVAC